MTRAIRIHSQQVVQRRLLCLFAAIVKRYVRSYGACADSETHCFPISAVVQC